MQANPITKPLTPVPSSPNSASTSYQASVPVTVYRELAAELQTTQAKLSFFQLQNEQLTRQNQMLLQEFEIIAQSTDRIQAILTQSNLPESRLSEVLAGLRTSTQVSTSRSQAQSRTAAYPKPEQSSEPYSTSPVHQTSQTNKPEANLEAAVNPRKKVVTQNGNAIQEAIARAKHLAQEAQTAQPSVPPVSSEALYYDSSFAAFPPAAPAKTLPKIEIREEIGSRPLSHNESDQPHEQSGLSGWVLVITVIAIICTSFGAGYLLMRPFVK
ncbi:MAG: hypothetical protein NW214_05775 [Pseudanabaenaceae cyanobacterium bins.39]|nr:hypothetical protein [Pseudanabaenaceae cyanobacterium bins.39]